MTYPDPRYLGDGEVNAWFRPSDAPAELDLGEGGRASYIARGESTNGQFGLYRWEMGPQPGGPATHFHRTFSESFYVLSGTVRIFDGEQWIDATVGDFVYVPEGGLHAFRNDSGEPASMLILFSPGAPREGYFEGLIEMFGSGRQLAEGEFEEFCARHDTYFV